MNEHTLGPWRISEDFPAHVHDPRGLVVANAFGYASIPPLTSEANARLIAAAPDLLAACRMAASRCIHCKGDGFIDVKEFDGASGCMEATGRTERCPACGPILAAIRKAEGNHHP